MADTKISAFTAVTDLQDTDQFVIARGGVTNKVTGASLKAAISSAPQNFAIDVTDAPYSAVGDGVANDTAAIQAAIDVCLTTPGRTVFLPRGTYLCGQLTLKGAVRLVGESMAGTILRASAIGVDFIVNDQASVDEMLTELATMTIDCDNQTAGRGIYLGTTHFDPNTPTFYLHDIYLHDSAGDGITLDARGGLADSVVHNVVVYRCLGKGFVVGADQHYISCVAAQNGAEGFWSGASASLQMDACKAYGNGAVNPASGYGYHLTALGAGCSLSACNAQDNKAAGFLLDTGSRFTLVGCVADSNSARGIGSNAGLELFNCGNSVVEGFVSVDRNPQGTGIHQTNGVKVTTDGTAARIGNRITLTHSSSNGTMGAAVNATSANLVGTSVTVGAQGGSRAVAYAATVTPDPYTGSTVIVGALTANITIAAPSNAHPGCPLTIVLKQDATGSRTVTWNAVFVNTPTTVTAANGYTIGRFVYDGTNWIGV